MDRLLARTGAWPWYVAAVVATFVSGEGGHSALWQGFANLAAAVLFPVTFRARALGTADRADRVRDFAFRRRWPLAVGYGLVACWYAQRYGTPWFAVVEALAAGAAMAWAAARPPVATGE